MESIYSEKYSEEPVHFSDKDLLFYNLNSDESQIKSQLMQIGNIKVFSRSSQVTQYYWVNIISPIFFLSNFPFSSKISVPNVSHKVSKISGLNIAS